MTKVGIIRCEKNEQSCPLICYHLLLILTGDNKQKNG